MITPGQPLEVTVTDGSPDVLWTGFPTESHPVCRGREAGSLVSGSSPANTPWPDVVQSRPSPADTAGWAMVVSGGFQPWRETSRLQACGTVTDRTPRESFTVTVSWVPRQAA